MNICKIWFCAVLLMLSSSPADSELVEGNFDEQTIKLLNMETGQLLRTLTTHASSVNCVAFSPDGKILASGSFDKTIKLWDMVTGKELATLGGSHSISELGCFRS